MSATAILDKNYRDSVIRFIDSNYMGKPGRYRYSAACSVPTLYSSTYAAMTLSLFGKEIPDREQWIQYFCDHQDEDGLFRDPAIWGVGFEFFGKR